MSGGAASAGLVDIAAVEAKICSVEADILATENKINEVETHGNEATPADKDWFRQKEMALRKEKEQLRKKEEQLRREKELLLQRLPPVPDGAVKRTSSSDQTVFHIFHISVPPSEGSKLVHRRQLQLGVTPDGQLRYDGVKQGPDAPPLLPDGLPLAFMGRPKVPLKFAPPAELVHPAFGEFLDDVRAGVVGVDECATVLELTAGDVMPGLHEVEKTYQDMFCEILSKLLHRFHLWPSSVRGGSKRKRDGSEGSSRYFDTDGIVFKSMATGRGGSTGRQNRARSCPLVILEAKLGDAAAAIYQIVLYYHAHYNNNEPLELRRRLVDVYPCLGIEVVGCLFRVCAVAGTHKDHVLAEPLTPFLSLTDSFPRMGEMDRLANVFWALRRAVKRLDEHYDALRCELQQLEAAAAAPASATPAQERGGLRPEHLRLPYPLRPLPVGASPELAALGLIPCTAEWLVEEKLLFKVLRRPAAPTAGEAEARPAAAAEAVVVKFCSRPFDQGQPVHALWASARLAPALHAVVRLPGGIHMVVMEFLDPGDGWVPLCALSPEAAGRVMPAVRAALARGHELRMGEDATVHGDVRSPNVMLRLTPERTLVPGGVRFVDFDWAGVDGVVLCPSFLNPDVKWPAGMVTGQRLTQQLDRDMLNLDPLGQAPARGQGP